MKNDEVKIMEEAIKIAMMPLEFGIIEPTDISPDAELYQQLLQTVQHVKKKISRKIWRIRLNWFLFPLRSYREQKKVLNEIKKACKFLLKNKDSLEKYVNMNAYKYLFNDSNPFASFSKEKGWTDVNYSSGDKFKKDESIGLVRRSADIPMLKDDETYNIVRVYDRKSGCYCNKVNIRKKTPLEYRYGKMFPTGVTFSVDSLDCLYGIDFIGKVLNDVLQNLGLELDRETKDRIEKRIQEKLSQNRDKEKRIKKDNGG